MAFDIGLWRSPRGDTHPHVNLDIDWDYWPQATHLVWEAPALVACVTGGGGGSQQAMFKKHLDPLLAGALERWQKTPLADPPATSLSAWFAEVQATFDATVEPPWADEFACAAVAVLARPDGAAIGNVGMERAWRWRDGRLTQITKDFTLADHGAAARGQQLPDWFRQTPGSMLRKRSPDREAFIRWQVATLDLAPGDVIVLASGIHDTGITTSYLAGAIEQMFDGNVVGAQDLATRLGDTVTRFASVSNREDRTEWKVHSRVALAVVWNDR
ncbi:MAG: hypothetical protein H0V17_30690 [Deltaproteobacteria bacterium]|nr:hypothetical protein [Deltaproteobacteria bacterium]